MPSNFYGMWWWAWSDRRWRILILPVAILQVVYILIGEPHSLAWKILGGVMFASVALYVGLRIHEWQRTRRVAKSAS